MIRSLIYKIIAISSLAVGMLGPQVASGNIVHIETQSPVRIEAEAIPVVVNPASENTQVIVENDCTGQLTWRLDLLLWQTCDFAIEAKTLGAQPQVAVKQLDNSGTKLSVRTGPTYDNPIELNDSDSQTQDFVFSNTIAGLYREQKTSVEFINQRIALAEQSKILNTNSFSMVMRC